MSKLIQCSEKSTHWFFDHSDKCPWCELQTEYGIDVFPSTGKGLEIPGEKIISRFKIQNKYIPPKTGSKSKKFKYSIFSLLIALIFLISIIVGINNYSPINEIKIPSLPVNIDSLNDEIEEAYDLYNDQQYSEALKKFRNLNKNRIEEIERISDKKTKYGIRYRIMFGMAMSLWKNGETNKALEILKDAEYYARNLGDDEKLTDVLSIRKKIQGN
jgi:hypothetical protein